MATAIVVVAAKTSLMTSLLMLTTTHLKRWVDVSVLRNWAQFLKLKAANMATTTISFYCAEQATVVDLKLSPADAERALTDTVFATKLLTKAFNQQSGPSTSTNVDNDLSLSNDAFNINSSNEECLDTEDTGDLNSETHESEASLYRWSTPCVLLLLETYRALEKDFSSGKISQKKIWERIAKELSKKEYNVTGPQCSSKLRSLKKTYKSIKDHNSKSGNDSWQYFDIMEEIFAKKAWCDPVAVASSTGLSSKQSETNESMGESDSGCSIKSNKTQVATLLAKRLRQKDDHEEQRMKRHKERMEMDEKFLKVLEKLANK